MFGNGHVSKPQRSTSPFCSSRGSPSPAAAPVSPSTVSRSSGVRPGSSSSERTEFSKPKENVTVTVRFRPLSARELKKGDETAWYADGECTVRNEDNPNIAYAFDRVFGPATTTRHVYDIAAHHVVSGAMKGVNGTVFAYGVTSSGKTHTMHGEQKSPGIIPLAVKDIFEIIQETPEREFLLRVSYLEIYNEVINDLLDPTGQNLRIREDNQGTYIERIKEEVVLSPAHALSLIATGEEHRHVGCNNFNLLSSRSHTIFTLTIESSPHGQNQGDEDVTLSQLHLIDLAGSESSKTETNGLRRKEGSYINKSLLTLGTVISKLTDGKATHIPYRDSKLTRLLQSSLSGNGRISLICTVTPASSNSEETHNTLKFAHRSKRVEIKASQNRILDEKSLIKKYQKEISNLKQELKWLKTGRGDNPSVNVSKQEDLISLKLQQEAGQVKRHSGAEEVEQTKAALMGRIQRLTKLILVSTKNSNVTNIPQKSVNRRRRSFGEDELAYLPDRKREHAIEEDDDDGSLSSEVLTEGCRNVTNIDELAKDRKKNKRKGMLGWFKSRKPEHIVGLSSSADSRSSASGSPASCSTSSLHKEVVSDEKARQRKSFSRKDNGPAVTKAYPETCATIDDRMDLLNEEVKLLAREIALSTSSLKRLSEQAAKNQGDCGIKEQIQKLKDEIKEKTMQIHQLEQHILGSLEADLQSSNTLEMSQALAKLATQLNEKTIELEVKSEDNRILEEELKMKVSANVEIQGTVLQLRQQLNTNVNTRSSGPEENSRSIPDNSVWNAGPINLEERNVDEKDSLVDATTPTSVISLNRIFSQEDTKDYKIITTSTSQAAEVEKVKQENVRLAEEKDGLESHNQKLAEEASYAKELAAAAAVELQNLTEEVAKLSYQNSQLIDELDSVKKGNCRSEFCQHLPIMKQGNNFNSSSRKPDYDQVIEHMQKELDARNQRVVLLKAALSQKEQAECELQKQLSEAKRQEKVLEDELANVWSLIANTGDSFMKSGDVFPDKIGLPDLRSAKTANKSCSLPDISEKHENDDKMTTREELIAGYLKERRRSQELESLISRLKGEDLIGLDVASLEELQNIHVESITKICQAKYANHLL